MWRLLILPMMSVLVSTSLSGSDGCPAATMCTCKRLPREAVPTTYLYYISVKCKGFNSSVTLSNITREIKVSNLDGDSVNELFRTLSAAELGALRTLAITHSALNNNISDAVFEQIRYLTLSQNNLTIVPKLSERLNLTLLDLSGNALADLSLNRFIKYIEALNLSVNLIEEVNKNSFSSLQLLKVLDISRNKLRSLSNDSLRPLENLQFLNLSRNKLRVLHGQCFSSLSSLQQLDVSWNNLARVAPGSLQLPSLSRLLLAGNSQLGDPYELLLGIGQRVQIVDVSRTGLKQVPAAITHSIKTLKLLDNTIKTVSCGELDAYPLLQHLDLSSNDIVSLEDDALGRLEYLLNIHLTKNKIVAIPRSLPETLRELHLGYNNIAQVARLDLKDLPKLEVLILNDNKIATIEPDSFTVLKSLVTLDLSRNSIRSLYPGSFPEPSSLQILRLSGIDTVSPAADVSFPFSSPDNLVSLDLSSSPGLARQFLEDTAALAASRELQELDISGAGLEHIRSDLFHFLSQLRVIRLRDNRLNCTGLGWLARWMRRQVRAEHGFITCASPPELWGMSLLDLEFPEMTTVEEIGDDLSNFFVNGDKNLNNTDVISKNVNTTSVIDDRISSVPKTSRFHVKNSTLINDDEKIYTESVPRGMKSDSRGGDGRLAAATEEGTINTRNSLTSRQNETPKKFLIKGGAPASRTRHERIFNDTFGLKAPHGSESGKGLMQILREVNLTDNVSAWNASAVKTSMFQHPHESTSRPHPGTWIMAAGVLSGSITLLVLLVRFARNRLLNVARDPEIIPVTSIASVSDLW